MVVFICYARSGGTLLNKILASSDKSVVMSEVSVIDGGGWGSDDLLRTVKRQAKSWYGYNLVHDDFYKSVVELNQAVGQDKKLLILRDWTYINYPVYGENPEVFSNELQVKKLDSHIKNVKYFALVRNAIDVWLSMDCPNINRFGKSYLKYISDLHQHNIKMFKYEQLVDDPDTVIKTLSNLLSLDLTYHDFWKVENINGDNQTKSRGGDLKRIEKLPRKEIDILNLIRLSRCDEIKKANLIMGYSPNYFENNHISFKVKFKSVLLKSIYNFSRHIYHLIKGRPSEGAFR